MIANLCIGASGLPSSKNLCWQCSGSIAEDVHVFTFIHIHFFDPNILLDNCGDSPLGVANKLYDLQLHLLVYIGWFNSVSNVTHPLCASPVKRLFSGDVANKFNSESVIWYSIYMAKTMLLSLLNAKVERAVA